MNKLQVVKSSKRDEQMRRDLSYDSGKAVWYTREEWMRCLRNLMQTTYEVGDYRTTFACIREIGISEGFNVPTRHDQLAKLSNHQLDEKIAAQQRIIDSYNEFIGN